MWTWLHKLGSPARFYSFSSKLTPWFGGIALLCILAALYGGLFLAPGDRDQGDLSRIIYVHVPAAWMSLFVYVFMATNAAIGIIWRLKVSDILAASAAPIGAAFTALALITGAVWGKPTWGTWWVWDARLTSELLMLFLYLGYIALHNAIEDPRQAARAAGILAIVGVINIPIIHYSVEWWHSLHQGPMSIPKTELAIVWPLLVMMTGFQFYFGYVLLKYSQLRMLKREINSRWAREVLS